MERVPTIMPTAAPSAAGIGLHRVAIAVEGMDAPIPTMMVAVDIDSALRIADRCLGGAHR